MLSTHKYSKTGFKIYQGLEDNILFWNESSEVKSLLEKAENPKYRRDFLSENSEDALTFSLFHTLSHKLPKETWLYDFLSVAVNKSFAEAIKSHLKYAEIKFWQEYNSPEKYLAWLDNKNRARKPEAIISHKTFQYPKSQSDKRVELLQRVKSKLESDTKDWEGPTQVDMEISIGKELLVFVEAKLGSDISLDTTYNPTRNQIIRNIDVGIDVKNKHGYRDFKFILLTPDKAPGKQYYKYLLHYRGVEAEHLQNWNMEGNPVHLKNDLQHIEESDDFFRKLTKSFGWVTWSDMIKLVLKYWGTE